jgi:hypothetical protein
MLRWAALVLVAGCGRVGFDPLSQVTGPDGAPGDGGAGADGSVGPCSTVGADTIALYRFDASADPYADATGEHDAILAFTGGTIGGPCGSALLLDTGNHLRVPDSPEFDLATGSIELRAWIPAPATGFTQAMLARDAVGTDFDGHVMIGVSPTGQPFVRLQRTGGVEACRCGAPIAAQTWIHVAASFGGSASEGFQMWLDGVPQTGTTYADTSGVHDCTTTHPFGMDGNNNPLVIGATNWIDANDDPTPVGDGHLGDGAMLDEIHVRSSWRDFGSM